MVFDLELKEGIVATIVVFLINIGVTMFLATVL